MLGADLDESDVGGALTGRELFARLSPAGIFRTDPSGAIVEANLAFYRMTGLPEAAASGMTWLDAVDIDDRDVAAASAEWRDIVALHQGARIDFRMAAGGGPPNWMRIEVAPDLTSSGQLLGFVGTLADIDDLKRTETKLAASEERLRVALDAAKLGLWEWDVAAGTGWWSRQAREIMGVHEDRLMTTAEHLALIHPDDRAIAIGATERLIKKGESFAVRYRVRPPGQSERWVASRGAATRDENGRTVRATGTIVDITEERAATERLRLSEERLRLAQTAGEVGVFDWNIVTDETWWSPEQDRIHGWNRETPPTYSEWQALVHPDDLPRVEAEIYDATATAVRYEIDYRVIRPNDGATRWVSVRSEVIRAPDGKALRIVGGLTDVTARREIEAALAARVDELAAISDTAPAAIWVAEDAECRKATGNRHARELLGLGEGDNHSLSAVPAERPPHFRTMRDGVELRPEDLPLQRAARGEPVSEEEWEVHFDDGRVVSLLGTAETLRDADGSPRGAVMVALDISDIHAARAALEVSEDRLRLAVDNAEIGFWDVDVVNDRLIWPARTKALFGISPEVPVTMQDFYDGLHPDDREATSAAYAAAADPALRALYDVEYRTIGKEDGVVRWIAAKGRGVFAGENPDAACLRVTGTAVDVSAKVGMTNELRQLNATLEQRVAHALAERETALAQLHEAQKLETLGQLTGGVAHDFNNLLTPIVGAFDVLKRRHGEEPRDARLIDGGMAAAERARTLVHRLLAFGRRQLLQAKPVDVAGLVHGLMELIRGSTGARIVVETDLPVGLPPARVDPNQLEMALLNLSINARDAMPEGGHLRIAAAADMADDRHPAGLAPGDYVRLDVADTGTGMSEETLRRAFEPFFTTKGVGKGTGLGLSMAHGLAAQSGGALDIVTKPGEGTTIRLWLPVARTEPPVPRDDGPASAKAAETAACVLLVDDEELVRLGTADMLSDLGYSVIEAESGPEALRILDEGTRVDALVTDFLMPEMTGGDLVRAARVRRPGMPALIVTGYVDPAGHGVDAPVIAKPFRQTDLATRLAGLIRTG